MARTTTAVVTSKIAASPKASRTLNRSSLGSANEITANEITANDMVLSTMTDRVSKIDVDTCEPDEGAAFLVADLGEVYRQQQRWKILMPRVKPHYAVKCNPDTQVLRLLAKLGTGFDCASKGEIDRVLGLGVDPSRIIYANPCKEASHVRYAAKVGVKQMVFDNGDELVKIKKCAPQSELFLRILVDDSSSMCRLGQKYGAPLDTTCDLLHKAKELDLKVVGVSFHCGSGVSDPQAFANAVIAARSVFDTATTVGFELKTLDVGGGFTGDLFESSAENLNQALADHFPPSVRIISEPGRYYVSSAYTLACHIIGRRNEIDPETDQTMYKVYINDGVYGNFASIMYDHQHPTPLILSKADPSNEATAYSIWGQTCDGIDKITGKSVLPGLLSNGDWLYFEQMGAYTNCCATEFNGFKNKHDIIYVSSEPGAMALLN